MEIHKVQNFVVKGKEVFVGLEDSKKTWKIAVRCDRMLVHQTSMPAEHEILIQYLRNKFPECKIRLMYEAGFKGFNLFDKLMEEGIDCVVIPPHVVTEPKVNRVKTDKRDAKRLALVLENHDFKDSCFVPDKERREDRQISRTLWAMQKNIICTRNQIRKLLDFHGIEVPFPDRWGEKEFQALKELPLGNSLKKSLMTLIALLEQLWAHKESLQEALRALCSKERYKKAYQIAMSLPGVGWYTAIRLVLELGEDLSRFTSGKKIAGFVGLGCSEHSTGETERKGRITGMGLRLHQSDAHRKLMDGDTEGPRPSGEVYQDMERKRNEEEGDRRSRADAHCASSGLSDLRAALCDRNGEIGSSRKRRLCVLAERRRTTSPPCEKHVF